jgi:hypothetical protein
VAVYAHADQRDYGAIAAMLVLLQSLAGTLGTTIAVAINESRSAVDDARSFTEGQQFAFTVLLPLLVVSVFVSLLAGKLDRRPRRDEVVMTEATPERRT